MKQLQVIFFSFLMVNVMATESIDSYNGGKLKNSLSIDDFSTDHILKLFRARGQLYVHQELGKALEGLSFFMTDTFDQIERVQLGDLSSKMGGEIPRHKSHQNGLDADIVYFRVNRKEQSSSNPEWEEYFVKSSKLTTNFDVSRNWQAFKYLVKNHPVQRIFVDQAVKKAICSFAKSKGELETEKEVLRALRIENTVHKSHFHIRLRCPKNSPTCTDQEEPPTGSGC